MLKLLQNLINQMQISQKNSNYDFRALKSKYGVDKTFCKCKLRNDDFLLQYDRNQ